MHPRLLEGVEHFNASRFWEAHEAWEGLWLEAAGEEKEFLQGLIQLAAAYHHMKRGTLRGGVRLFDRAARRLDPFPPCHGEIDRAAAVAASQRDRAWAASLLEAGEPAPMSPDRFPQLAICAPLLQGASEARSTG